MKITRRQNLSSKLNPKTLLAQFSLAEMLHFYKYLLTIPNAVNSRASLYRRQHWKLNNPLNEQLAVRSIFFLISYKKTLEPVSSSYTRGMAG